MRPKRALPPLPKANSLGPIERIRGEVIQVGNRYPAARRDLDDIDRMLYDFDLEHGDDAKKILLA